MTSSDYLHVHEVKFGGMVAKTVFSDVKRYLSATNPRAYRRRSEDHT